MNGETQFSKPDTRAAIISICDRINTKKAITRAAEITNAFRYPFFLEHFIYWLQSNQANITIRCYNAGEGYGKWRSDTPYTIYININESIPMERILQAMVHELLHVFDFDMPHPMIRLLAASVI